MSSRPSVEQQLARIFGPDTLELLDRHFDERMTRALKESDDKPRC